MSKLIVLNHKMGMEYDQVFSYVDSLNKIDTDNNIVICPSYIYLNYFLDYCHWGIGSQDVSKFDSGDYTGEVSALQLKSLGIEYCIIGHYERRKFFNESLEDIHDKLVVSLESNIIPILCFGESGDQDDIISSLDILLKDITNIDFIVFAYEPLKVKCKISVSDIREQISFIYDYLFDKYHSKPNIIYGGGIYEKDISSIMKIDKLNGLLVGKVSSRSDKVKRIINCCLEVNK